MQADCLQMHKKHGHPKPMPCVYQGPALQHGKSKDRGGLLANTSPGFNPVASVQVRVKWGAMFKEG